MLRIFIAAAIAASASWLATTYADLPDGRWGHIVFVTFSVLGVFLLAGWLKLKWPEAFAVGAWAAVITTLLTVLAGGLGPTAMTSLTVAIAAFSVSLMERAAQALARTSRRAR